METGRGSRRRALARLLGAGSLGFAAAQLAQPRRFAEWVTLPTDRIRLLGARDLFVGAALLARPEATAPLLARAASDAADAVQLRHRPAMAAFAGVAAVVALVGTRLR